MIAARESVSKPPLRPPGRDTRPGSELCRATTASGRRPPTAIEGLLRQNRQEVLRIASKYGAHKVRVFGSVARGEGDASSDVDFLVELEAGRSLLDLGGLQFEQEALPGHKVDVATQRGLKPSVRDQVLRGAIPV
jgi:predicted nucleotidyltransferase